MNRDLSTFQPVKAKSSNSGICSISIINTAENGRRVKLSKAAVKSLSEPETIQFAVSTDTLIIAAKLEGNPTKFNVSKGCVYSSALVLELTEFFSLDFSDGRTSQSFPGEAEVFTDSGITVLYFKLK
ncbi:MAG: hypothetical protein PHT78_11035 [Desulfitobacteriaceae bacterium]|nr:hypothetical protein [Desulfitobacteriaceae bacterium]